MSSTSTTSSEMPQPNGAEPKAAPVAVPIVLFVILAVLFYFAALYIDEFGGGFNARVYAPYSSTKELDKFLPKKTESPMVAKGRQLYAPLCGACHGDNGMGSSANGCPPLAGSEWVNGSPGRLVRIISKGLTGPIQVKGQQYGSGSMPNVGDGLPGSEQEKAESIAAIATFIRAQWGNKAPALKPEDVAKIRGEIKDHPQSFTADELLEVQ